MSRSQIVIVIATLGLFAGPQAHAQTVRTPQGGPGSVTLSLAEYNRLLDRAEHPIKHIEPPPIPAVLARAEIAVRVTDTRAQGVCTLDGEVFASGATRVPIMRDATILSATHGATPLPLVFDDGVTSAILAGPAPFSLTLEWGASLEFSPGRTTMTLPVPESGSASAAFELPGAPTDVTIAPGAVTRLVTTGSITRVEATLVPGHPARVTWTSRQSSAAKPGDLRMAADVKSLVSIGESDARMAALIDLTIIRGQTGQFECRLPPGYTVTSVTGPDVGRTEDHDGLLTVSFAQPAERTHRVLVMMENTAPPGPTIQTPVLTVAGAERETGEIGVEASGTVDLVAHESDLLRRIDVREASASLRALAQTPLLSALRYHRRGSDVPTVALDVTRYPDASVVAAVAERAVATTLVTSDGRMLTEVSLTLRNRAQPFLRVELPAGATIVSAEVAGEAAKIAQGSDGVRVPLFRPGFRPDGAYTVSFVYMHSGQAFQKKGRAELVLPTMDVPFSLMEWELFVPDRYRVKHFEGDALLMPGTMDENGAITPGSVAETVMVQAEPSNEDRRQPEKSRLEQAQAPSQNVFNLQRRVAGVLPVRVDVPRAGVAYRFVRPLVFAEPTRVSFDYRSN